MKYELVPIPDTRSATCGVAVDVLCDGFRVATVYEDPSRTGGLRRYDTAFVSMNHLRWAGESPDMAHDLPRWQRPTYLAYDFVCNSAQTAEEALPEVAEHVAALVRWRDERAVARARAGASLTADMQREMHSMLRARWYRKRSRLARRPGLTGLTYRCDLWTKEGAA